MRVWAIANQKGGVGKTTTAVTLAGLLSEQGRRVLMVDLDPHGSLTTYFGYDPDAIESSVYSLFQGNAGARPAPQSVVKRTAYEGLELLPASTALATLDRQLGAREGMGLIIGRALASMGDSYEHVFLDCPPVLGVLMINAMAAAEHLLIPVQTEFLALKGLERMLHTLGMITQARKRKLSYTIVPTMFDRRTRAALETLKALRDRYGDDVWRSVIPVDNQFREASRQGMPLSRLNPQSRGAIAYGALLTDLVGDTRRLQNTVA